MCRYEHFGLEIYEEYAYGIPIKSPGCRLGSCWCQKNQAYPCIRLYDTEEHEIGKVELTSKTGMGTYTMSLDGKKLGTLTRKMSVKIKMDLSFNGWHLDGNLMQSNFVVTDKNGNQVMKFNNAFSSRDTYVLEMNNREHEILGLLLVMAVEIALHGND